MKKAVIILSAIALLACNQTAKNNSSTLPQEEILQITYTNASDTLNFIDNESDVNWDSLYYEAMKGDLKNFKLYHLNDTIVQDLNGDSIAEKIFFNENKNIIIVDGKTNAETKFYDDNFNVFGWVSFWGVTTDRETYRILFDDDGAISGDETVSLHFPSIFVRKYESGGGIITCNKEKYVWIHQND